MFYEIEPGLSINSDLVWKVEVKNKKVEWKTAADEKESFDYGSNAAAIIAYNDYIAFANSIHVGKIDLAANEIVSGLLANDKILRILNAQVQNDNDPKTFEERIADKAYEIASFMVAI